MRYPTQTASQLDYAGCTVQPLLDNKTTSSTSSPRLTSAKKANVLLVEDDPIIQKVHRMMLEKIGCLVDVAANGHQAIALAEKQYDLILMDIGLPDMDGFTITSNIRLGSAKHTFTPIVAITAYGEAVTEECLSAGIDEVATKPVRFEELCTLVKKWLIKK